MSPLIRGRGLKPVARLFDKMDFRRPSYGGLILNGGKEHALFSLYLEGYSKENAEKLLDAVLEKMSFGPQ